MWKENLYQPVEVLVRSHSIFPLTEHQHSFFEMVYVTGGTGRFYVKEAGYKLRESEYREGALFLIPPETTHCFTTETTSEYVFIRFVISYVEDFMGKRVAEVLRSYGRNTEIRLDGRDERTAEQLFSFIKSEEENRREGSRFLQQKWLDSIIMIVSRSIADSSSFAGTMTDDRDSAVYMLEYIQQHINEPDLLKAENLAGTFHLAPGYIGNYFKRHYQETLQHYIAGNRLKTVENLLTSSRMTVKEIAYRMGYSDSSHLVRSFRKAYGVSPLKYRQKAARP